MKLTLRPEWRLWPFSTFFGVLDLKTGIVVILLFAVLNKVAGIYGLIAVLTGAGGSFAQLTLYIYSALALVAFVWGLKAVREEDPKNTLYFAHVFSLDHILSTIWTAFFAVGWWMYTPHDGRRVANSAAQEEMMHQGPGPGNMSEAERTAAALGIWNREKHTAAAVIILAWLLKVYFAALLYSYASHLRKGTYRALPRTRMASATTSALAPEDDDDDLDMADESYRLPRRTPAGSGTFTDFVAAPGSRQHSRGRSGLAEEVLFDEDEAVGNGSARRGQS